MNKGEQVIEAFWHLLSKMMWLNEFKMKELLKDYKPSEVHCIEYIGKNSDSNVTRLARYFHMTTGAITKLTKKLMEKEVIESYHRQENKKELYFRLTERGEAVYEVHEKLHQEFQNRDNPIFEQIKEEDYEKILHFAEAYSGHLDEEIKKLNVKSRIKF